MSHAVFVAKIADSMVGFIFISRPKVTLFPCQDSEERRRGIILDLLLYGQYTHLYLYS